MLFLTALLALYGCERETPPPDASPGVDGSTMRPDGSTMQPDTGGTCIPTPENTEAACTDGIDNDCDGHIDCIDFDCRAFCGVENSNRACSDGVDNDNNGFIDCADFACQDRIVCSGEVTNAACSDGEDNDEDGLIDCADPDCQREAIVVCNGDQYADPMPESSEWPDLIADRCTDGDDNDGNRFFDCGDHSCLWNYPDCVQPLPEATNAACSDGEDNDLDGLTDCDDPDCRREGIVVCRNFDDEGNAIVPDESEWEALSNEECSNGINEDESDQNTFIDCADRGCYANPDVTVCTENTDEQCSDGVDNDPEGAYGRGFIDCDDHKCSRNPFVTVCTAREFTYEECTDGIDNDNDGWADCKDFACENSIACR